MDNTSKKFVLTNGLSQQNSFLQVAGSMIVNNVFYIVIILFSLYLIYKYNPFRKCEDCNKINGFESTGKPILEQEEMVEQVVQPPVNMETPSDTDDPIYSKYPYIEWEDGIGDWKRFDSIRY